MVYRPNKNENDNETNDGEATSNENTESVNDGDTDSKPAPPTRTPPEPPDPDTPGLKTVADVAKILRRSGATPARAIRYYVVQVLRPEPVPATNEGRDEPTPPEVAHAMGRRTQNHDASKTADAIGKLLDEVPDIDEMEFRREGETPDLSDATSPQEFAEAYPVYTRMTAYLRETGMTVGQAFVLAALRENDGLRQAHLANDSAAAPTEYNIARTQSNIGAFVSKAEEKLDTANIGEVTVG